MLRNHLSPYNQRFSACMSCGGQRWIKGDEEDNEDQRNHQRQWLCFDVSTERTERELKIVRCREKGREPEKSVEGCVMQSACGSH